MVNVSGSVTLTRDYSWSARLKHKLVPAVGMGSVSRTLHRAAQEGQRVEVKVEAGALHYFNVESGDWERVNYSGILGGRLEGHVTDLELPEALSPREIRGVLRALTKSPLHTLPSRLSKYGVKVTVASGEPVRLHVFQLISLGQEEALAALEMTYDSLSTDEIDSLLSSQVQSPAVLERLGQHPNVSPEALADIISKTISKSDSKTDVEKTAAFLSGRGTEFVQAVLEALYSSNTELAQLLIERQDAPHLLLCTSKVPEIAQKAWILLSKTNLTEENEMYLADNANEVVRVVLAQRTRNGPVLMKILERGQAEAQVIAFRKTGGILSAAEIDAIVSRSSTAPQVLEGLSNHRDISPQTLAKVLSNTQVINKSGSERVIDEAARNDWGLVAVSYNEAYPDQVEITPEQSHQEYNDADFTRAASFLARRTPEFQAAVIAALEALGNTELAEGLRTKVQLSTVKEINIAGYAMFDASQLPFLVTQEVVFGSLVHGRSIAAKMNEQTPDAELRIPTAPEVQQIRELLGEGFLQRYRDENIWLMTETPRENSEQFTAVRLGNGDCRGFHPEASSDNHIGVLLVKNRN